MRAFALLASLVSVLVPSFSAAEVVNLPVVPGSYISIGFSVYFEGNFLGGTGQEVTPVTGNINLVIDRDVNGDPASITFGHPTQFLTQYLEFMVDFSNTYLGNLGMADGYLNPARLVLGSNFPLALNASSPDLFSGTLEGQFASVEGQSFEGGAIGPATPGSFLDVALRFANPDDGIYNFDLYESITLESGPYGTGSGTISVVDGLTKARGATILIDAEAYDVFPIGGGLPFRIDVSLEANIVGVPESGSLILTAVSLLGFGTIGHRRSFLARKNGDRRET